MIKQFPQCKRNQCKAITKMNKNCRNFVVGNEDYCSKHDGAKRVRFKDERIQYIRKMQKDINKLVSEIRRERVQVKSKN